MADDSLFKILILEDLNSDAELIIRTLKKELSREFEYRHVKSRKEFIDALDKFYPDIILSDYGLPSITGLEALEISMKKNPDIPLIIVTGSINEETAVNCIKAGASDYVLKDNLIRLVPAINSSLEKYKLISSEKETKQALNQSEIELYAIFNSSPAIMMVIDSERKILKINKPGLDFSGKKPEEIFGKTIGKSLNCKSCHGDLNCGDLEECNDCVLKNFIAISISKKENIKSEEISVEIEKNGMSATHTFLAYLEQISEKHGTTYLVTLIDISERKKSVQKLIDSEIKYKALFESSMDGFSLLDTQGRHVEVNEAFIKMTGFTRDELINTGLPHPYWPPEEIEKIKNIFSDTIKGLFEEIELTFMRKNGERFPVIVNPSSIKNKNGEATHFFASFKDISNRKKVEERLKQSEAKFKELYEHVPIALFRSTVDGRILDVNDAMIRMYGFESKEDLLNTPAIEFYDQPQDRQKIIEALIEKGEARNIVTKEKRKDGSAIWIKSVYIAHKDELQHQTIKHIDGVAIDVTESKEYEIELNSYRNELEKKVKERTLEIENQAKKLHDSEKALTFLLDDVNESREELLASNQEIKKLSQAVEQSPSTVVITDTKGNIQYVNKHFCEITGYTVEEVLGKNPRILNSGVHPKEFFENLWKTINSGQAWHNEICNKKKNGEVYWEYSSISSIKNPNQEIINFVAVKEDITEKKLIEQKLKEYTEELEIFNKVMVDRELKIIEMKEEVNSLYTKLGLDLKYPPIWNNTSESN